MDGQNILYGDISELRGIREELRAHEDVVEKIDEFTVLTQRLRKDVAAEEKLLTDTIDATVKKRREQVVSDFDKQLKKTQDQLKKVKENRNKAKSKGIDARIKAETVELVQENKNLKEEIKTYMKQKNIPAIFNSNALYGLLFPRKVLDLVVLAILAVIFVIAIPIIVVKLLPWHIFFEVITFIVVAAIVPVIYALLFKYARVDHKDVFIEKREQRIKLTKNVKQISRIKKSIKKDKNEEAYNLKGYDDDIADLEDSINDIVYKKNNVLSKFETVTKPEIMEEITERETPRIEKAKAKLKEAELQLKSYHDVQKDMSMKLASHYSAYIGSENMNMAKIDKLIEIMEDGRAKTIGDAINIAKVIQ